MVEHQFSKLMAGVRFPHPALFNKIITRQGDYFIGTVRSEETSWVSLSGRPTQEIVDILIRRLTD
jgi:hypothetical protein